MVRGKKHKEIADGRTGRNGQKMVCRSTADQENNGDGGSTSSGPSGEPSMNQAKGHGVKKVLTFNDQLDKAEAVLGMKAVEPAVLRILPQFSGVLEGGRSREQSLCSIGYES